MRNVPPHALFAVPVIFFAALLSQASAQVSYDRSTGQLSAVVHGAPLRDVLAEISRKTGIEVYIDPTVDKTVFIERKHRPLDEVLSEVVAPLNNVLIYRGDRVTAIKIYERDPADAQQRIGPKGPQGPAGSAPEERAGNILEERRIERERRAKEQAEEQPGGEEDSDK